MAQSFYRKYRPEKFADIVGQDAVTKTLQNAIATERIAHAYLFCGSRGTGKTTTARVFAKAINCEHREKSAEPCAVCPACVEIQAGGAIDIVEIDAASHGLIDNIRDLRDVAAVLPSRLRYKVFIIDEAHGLSKSANNALLKILEEPPAHVVFILATTEPEKLLPTIISRTQRFDFWRLPVAEIETKLLSIARAERLDIDADAIRFIAESAGGSLRDAESILDQVAALKIRPITLAEASSVLGRPTAAHLEPLIAAILARNDGGAITALHAMEGAYSPFDLYVQVVNELRGILALALSPGLESLYARTLSPARIQSLKTRSKTADPRALTSFLAEFLRAEAAIRLNTLPFAALEISLVSGLTRPPEKGQ